MTYYSTIIVIACFHLIIGSWKLYKIKNNVGSNAPRIHIVFYCLTIVSIILFFLRQDYVGFYFLVFGIHELIKDLLDENTHDDNLLFKKYLFDILMLLLGIICLYGLFFDNSTLDFLRDSIP